MANSTTCTPVTTVTNCEEYSKNSDVCILCEIDYVLDGNECDLNTFVEHCVKYIDVDTCKTCHSDYYLSADKKSCIALTA